MASTTTGLTNLMSTYYDKVFLERAKAELRHDFGAQVKNHRQNMGKTISFNRFSPLNAATTPLTEATNPSDVNMTTALTSVSLCEFGNWVKVGSLFKMTSVDEDLKEHVEVIGQNAGETIDILIRNTLSASGVRQLPSTQAAVSSTSAIHTSDVLTGLEIRRAVRTLKNNKAPKFENAMYRGIIQPYTAMDLMGNSEWLDAHRYTDTDAIKRGVVGKLHGVEFVETNQGTYDLSAGFSTAASTVAAVFTSYIFGKNAYGAVNIESFSAPKVYVKNPGPSDTGNPIDIFSTVGWKMPFAAVILNDTWLVKVLTSATDGNL
jgi:N4-gp56 family major capsid protein